MLEGGCPDAKKARCISCLTDRDLPHKPLRASCASRSEFRALRSLCHDRSCGASKRQHPPSGTSVLSPGPLGPKQLVFQHGLPRPVSWTPRHTKTPHVQENRRASCRPAPAIVTIKGSSDPGSPSFSCSSEIWFWSETRWSSAIRSCCWSSTVLTLPGGNIAPFTAQQELVLCNVYPHSMYLVLQLRRRSRCACKALRAKQRVTSPRAKQAQVPVRTHYHLRSGRGSALRDSSTSSIDNLGCRCTHLV